MEFVSDGVRKMRKPHIELVRAAYRELQPNDRPYVDPAILERAKEYAAKYGNDKIARKELPAGEIPGGVVGFTHANPTIPEFFTVPMECMPYINGVHAGRAVALHEEMHIEIARYGGDHEEKAINNYVAAKLGYAVFPFPSY